VNGLGAGHVSRRKEGLGGEKISKVKKKRPNIQKKRKVNAPLKKSLGKKQKGRPIASEEDVRELGRRENPVPVVGTHLQGVKTKELQQKKKNKPDPTLVKKREGVPLSKKREKEKGERRKVPRKRGDPDNEVEKKGRMTVRNQRGGEM